MELSSLGSGRYESRTRYRDWDGQPRLVQASGATAKAAEWALKGRLADGDLFQPADTPLTPDSLFSDLVTYWLEDIDLEGGISRSTRNLYERNTLHQPVTLCRRSQVAGRRSQVAGRRSQVAGRRFKFCRPDLEMETAGPRRSQSYSVLRECSVGYGGISCSSGNHLPRFNADPHDEGRVQRRRASGGKAEQR
jgi:hypothetical protein